MQKNCRYFMQIGDRLNELVSIVLPVYNGEKYLRESIDSVLNQTYNNWELIIIDDCSSDTSPDIAKSYAARDKRIHYYRNEQNLKLPKSLNRGFSLTKGNYLTWTSDDNRYLPDAIYTMVNTLKENDACFVFAACNVIDESGKITDTYGVDKHSIKRIIGQNPVGACFMYTRDAYLKTGEYDPELFLVEDFDYWQRLCSQFKTVAIENILYDYRFHGGALTSTMKKELFYQNMKGMLLKNRPLFGKIDWEQKKYYYSALNVCADRLHEKRPYRASVIFYDFLYSIKYKVFYRFCRAIIKHG